MRKLQIVIQRVRKCVTSHLRGIKHGAEYDCGQRNAKGQHMRYEEQDYRCHCRPGKVMLPLQEVKRPFRVFVGIQGQTGNG